jgi:hypothetical protein
MHFVNDIWYQGTFIFSNNIINFQDTKIEIDFPIGTDIYVKNSNYNNGFYTVVNINEGQIFTNKNFTNETKEVRIYGVNYPKSSFLKIVMAEMIDYNINNDKYNITNETLGEASVSYKNIGSVYGYPKEIITKLDLCCF